MSFKKCFNHLKWNLSYDDLLVENTTNGRTYITPSGSRYPSVTTVLGELSKESIAAWRARIGYEEANRISSKAASRGTQLHTVAERYINNESEYLRSQMPHVIELFRSIQPILDSKVDNIHAQEIALFSDQLKIAGRVDCIAEYDDVLSIIDYKTSSKPKKAEWIESYFMQTAFYAAAYYEQTNIPITQSVIVIAVEANEPQVFVQPTYLWLPKLLRARNDYTKKYGI
jgi:RecB family exonuclease